MTDHASDLQSLGRRLVGEWTTEATHPALPGTVVHGTASVKWLEGERFLVLRSHSDHPDFPDSISIIGDTDGLRMHYFDSRGIHRIYDMTVTAEGWGIARDAPEFDQRLWVTFADGNDAMIGKSELSEDHETWNDDLQITYYRTHRDRDIALGLFAGISVSDYAVALDWYERLLGSPPSFFPNDIEAVWELAENRFVYIEHLPEHAGHAQHTIFVDDLDARVAAITDRGIDPANRETYSNGVRKVTYRDPDGNEIGFGGAPE